MVRNTVSNPNGKTVHEVLAPIILFGQLFSLMPISNYFQETPEKVRFTFKSVRWLYSCATMISIISIIILFLLYVIETKSFGLNTTGTIIYYTVIIIAMIEFLSLAFNWRRIMVQWTEAERPFLFPPYSERAGLPLESLVKRVAFTVALFAFIEDTLNFISAYKLNELHIKYCPHSSDFWYNFFRREHRHIIRIIPYHPVLGVVIESLMRVAKFTWHYIDVFIICVSLPLQYRFQQFNDRIESFDGSEQPRNVWRQIRLDFLRLHELADFLDVKLSRIILMSCANDMFFISVQLYNIFNPKATLFTTTYYWYSLLFLMSRCFIMLYIASSVNEASLKPLALLRSFSTSQWNLDLQRLLDHVCLKSIAFSGKRFFFITRPLILAMAGTIMTYELVMLDQVSKDQDTTKDCNF
ncbi:gustatory receptor for sugar taste 64a-like [Wyeomyia smithii]|uniref:gustatory receptor for sugar taste 64a-like n=1 Tax=Wyeomyia smithii TaxID=174621 RepID=UPI00246816F7|nr:gustatory receptor for sugar taste 64a-like [Wyeomyia smithii]